MGCTPTPLSLSLDTTLRPFLFSSSTNSPSTSPPSTTTTTTLSLHKSRTFPILRFLRRFSSTSPTTAPAPAPAPLDRLPRPGNFLGPDAQDRLQTLRGFRLSLELDRGGGGSLEIRQMEADELDATADLLAETFAESLHVPAAYVTLLAFMVKQYVAERLRLAPHVAVLVGFYKERGAEGAAQLAGTAEISFDAYGANRSPPTPAPPPDYPYICNMAVRKTLRRRGIGWNLLAACEELITQMKAKREVFLHCRVYDKVPFNMYKKANYEVVATNSIFVCLIFQQRKHLMSKKLPPNTDDTESNTPDHDPC